MRYQGGISTLQYCLIWGLASRWFGDGDNVVSAANDDNGKPESWYQKYDAYPPYCSIPEEMETRVVPPLQNVNRNIYGETRIQHVSAIIRHGARTPFASNEDCFPSYPVDPVDTEWNCKLTTIMTPPSVETIGVDEGKRDRSKNLDSSFFLFEKFYDALPYLKDGLSNELNGTCQKGQLIMQGYEQELKNGAILRDAYTYTYNSMDQDERMRLIELSYHEFSAWDPNHFRFRADNSQRTIMSGQVMLRGLFDNEAEIYFQETGKYPTIPLHIADRDRDIMSPSNHVCPRLEDIANQAKQSEEYQAFNNSEDAKQIHRFMDDKVGRMDDEDILDCLMTTMCTDRDLPNLVRDYGKPDSWFDKLMAYDVAGYNLIMKHNNAEHAKLSMGPLWAEIKDIWTLFLTRDNSGKNPSGPDGTVPPRLALYSGHDTTISPLLASISPDLWSDTDWAPYASMVLIEIHEFIDNWNRTLFDSRYAFRMIYNGEILTGKVPGCHEDLELCDLHTLLQIIEPFATRSTDCARERNAEEQTVIPSKAREYVNTKKGILMFFSLILLGVVFGGIGAYILLTGNLCGNQILSYTPIQKDPSLMRLQGNVQGNGGTFGSSFSDGFRDEPQS